LPGEFLSPSGWLLLQALAMRNFLLLLITLIVLIAVVGGGGALFYLAKTSEMTRVGATPPPSSPGN
jgi:hypothetical protein